MKNDGRRGVDAKRRRLIATLHVSRDGREKLANSPGPFHFLKPYGSTHLLAYAPTLTRKIARAVWKRRQHTESAPPIYRRISLGAESNRVWSIASTPITNKAQQDSSDA